jgi:hypothetical protein
MHAFDIPAFRILRQRNAARAFMKFDERTLKEGRLLYRVYRAHLARINISTFYTKRTVNAALLAAVYISRAP